MPTANRWSLPTRACCAFASVATIGSPGGWTMTGEGPQVTDVRRDCDEAHGGTCSVRLASAGGPGFGAVEPWTRYQLALDVPRNASVVAFGVLLHGSGRAWADDLALTVGDDRDVASTDMLPPDKVWRSLSPGPAALPRRPTNLGFED
jgi:hypothetical protein